MNAAARLAKPLERIADLGTDGCFVAYVVDEAGTVVEEYDVVATSGQAARVFVEGMAARDLDGGMRGRVVKVFRQM